VILGNRGIIIAFPPGLTDAEMLAGEFYPFFFSAGFNQPAQLPRVAETYD